MASFPLFEYSRRRLGHLPHPRKCAVRARMETRERGEEGEREGGGREMKKRLTIARKTAGMGGVQTGQPHVCGRCHAGVRPFRPRLGTRLPAHADAEVSARSRPAYEGNDTIQLTLFAIQFILCYFMF